MNKGSRLSGLASSLSRPARRLKQSGYSLSVTLVSPDQAEIDLWKDGKLVKTIMDIDPSDVDDSALDAQGRLKPSTIWNALQDAVQYVNDTYGASPTLPAKHEIFDGNYPSEKHPHPYEKT